MKIDLDIPEGKSGNWQVEHFTVSEHDASMHNLRCALNMHSIGRDIQPGNYVRLLSYGCVIMSNTPAEIRDHLTFISVARKAKNVLINGLGLGMAVKAVLDSPKVEQVIVVEKEIDVIALVAPYLKDERFVVRHDDAFTYKPPEGMRFGAVWHDIWPDICSDNEQEMHQLHTKYDRIAQWQGSWCRAECISQKRARA